MPALTETKLVQVITLIHKHRFDLQTFGLTYLLSRTWTGLPGRRPSAGRQDSRSTTPAVIIDVGIGCTVYTTVHCRRPSVSRRCGTNTEQFASRSDVITFPANFQNQTKILFIFHGVVSIVSELL